MPLWHTAGVLLLLSALVAGSTRLHGVNVVASENHRLVGYIVTMSAEWLITAFIWFGCRIARIPLGALTGDMTWSWRPMLRDFVLGIAFVIAANVVLALVAHLIHVAPNQSLRNLLPRTGAEAATFVLLAFTAAVCEEIIFRGYLQHQFTTLTKSASAGIIIQGILFGVSHAYQGSGMVVTISVYGCLFGLLAYWRGSLRPGMIAHFLQDGVGGLLLARYALK